MIVINGNSNNEGDDDDEEENDENEFSEDDYAECASKGDLSKSVEFGYTLEGDEAISVLVLPEILGQIEGAAPTSSMQVYKINVDNMYYYIVDKFNSSIYNINMDGRMGHQVGRLENGNVFFS